MMQPQETKKTKMTTIKLSKLLSKQIPTHLEEEGVKLMNQFKALKKKVAAHVGVSEMLLVFDTVDKDVKYGKKISFYILYEHLHISQRSIAKLFNRKSNHSYIGRGIREIKEMLSNKIYEEERKKIDKIVAEIKR